MQQHEQRVVIERAELEEKLTKLDAFFSSSIYRGLPDREKDLLKFQFSAMHHYAMILEERISAFRE